MGKITRLQLENFTCFATLDVEFSPGVNILIGTNGTGKTHILKVLYAACSVTVGEDKYVRYEQKLLRTFLPHNHNSLRFRRRPSANQKPTQIIVTVGTLPIMLLTQSEAQDTRVQNCQEAWMNMEVESTYIPAKEILAHAPGFISLTSKREIAFEDVYVDIVKQAYLPKLRKLPIEAYVKLHEALTQALGGAVVIKGEYFFLETEEGEIEFSLLAEGLRKIALLWLLIQNGSLNPGNILFWDEPEANLNPSLLGLVVETLLELQRQGVQVFLATHNYVLLKEFDLRKKPEDAVRYISLYKNPATNAVEAETTEDYLLISQNAIADAFSDLYKRDISRALGVGA